MLSNTLFSRLLIIIALVTVSATPLAAEEDAQGIDELGDRLRFYRWDEDYSPTAECRS